MEEFITDERTGLRYELVGDYYLIAGETSRGADPSAFGDSDTCGISTNTRPVCMPSCLPPAS